MLAAIGAATNIRPQGARAILIVLTTSDDEQIAEAAEDAVRMSEPTSAFYGGRLPASGFMRSAPPEATQLHAVAWGRATLSNRTLTYEG